ncbi:MAG: hypothetical protein ACOYLF_06990 [Blastocatellia bacterium]
MKRFSDQPGDEPKDPKGVMIRVVCSKCDEVIETSTRVGGQTMVYCIRCRRWCRELEDETPAATTPTPRRGRCH